MKEKVLQIRKALEAEIYLPALALALTLPDICGQIEYPKNGVRERYIKWFNDWVAHWYADDTGWIENGKKPKNPYFTGEMCYGLRCAYLHSGNSKTRYNFGLIMNSCDSYSYSNSDKTKIIGISVDVKLLCKNICDAAEKYYRFKEGKSFEEHHIKIIDIKKEVDKIEKLNKY